MHAQNSGIHSQKSDSNHYFGVDSTIIWEWIQLQMKWSLYDSKKSGFHSTALREYDVPLPCQWKVPVLFCTECSPGGGGGGGGKPHSVHVENNTVALAQKAKRFNEKCMPVEHGDKMFYQNFYYRRNKNYNWKHTEIILWNHNLHEEPLLSHIPCIHASILW